MFSMKRAASAIAVFLTTILCTSPSYGIYFTLQLKNGNEIITDHYTDDNVSSIHFYTNEGAVSIPKSSIKSIKSNDGSISIEIEEEQKKNMPLLLEDEAAEQDQEKKPREKETDKDRIASINDQLAIINANLDNLAKNKNIFVTQQEQYQQQKQKSEERIATLKKSPDAGARDIKESIELEQTRFKDIEAKLEDLQQRIKNNDQMYDAQQRIRLRFEADLEKIKK